MGGEGKFALPWPKRSGDGENCFQEADKELQNWMETLQHYQGSTSARSELWFCLPSPDCNNLVAICELRPEQLCMVETTSMQTQSHV